MWIVLYVLTEWSFRILSQICSALRCWSLPPWSYCTSFWNPVSNIIPTSLPFHTAALFFVKFQSHPSPSQKVLFLAIFEVNTSAWQTAPGPCWAAPGSLSGSYLLFEPRAFLQLILCPSFWQTTSAFPLDNLRKVLLVFCRPYFLKEGTANSQNVKCLCVYNMFLRITNSLAIWNTLRLYKPKSDTLLSFFSFLKTSPQALVLQTCVFESLVSIVKLAERLEMREWEGIRKCVFKRFCLLKWRTLRE